MEAGALPNGRWEVRRVALVSLLAAVGLVAAKLGAGLASGSLALLSEATHSGLDAAMTTLTFLAVTVAARPPDADHPYGHGKAENVAALVQAVVLAIVAIIIGFEAVQRLRQGDPRVEAAWYTFAAAAVSIVVDLSRARILRRTARQHRSPALEADAVNFSADVLTSSGVLSSLVLVRFGLTAADAVAGLLIAAYVAWSGVRVGRGAVDVLMDRTPVGAAERLAEATGSVAGVEEVRRVRIRYAGGQPQADVVVGVSRTVPLETAHDVTERIEEAIRAVEPGADVVVHVEPLADEQIVSERVMSLSARHPEVRQVHNIFVARRSDGLHISLHAKLPGSMPLAIAHAIVDRLEDEIRAGIDGVARVDTHLEPLERPATTGSDVTSEHDELVGWARDLAERQPEVENCHEVVVTDTTEGLSMVMHCEAPAGLLVSQAHAASTRIENDVHRAWPEVERVTVHFEPVEH